MLYTGVLRGHFGTTEVLRWLKTTLLSELADEETPRQRVIVLNHCETIEQAGYLVRFLLLYPLDFNYTELAWWGLNP